MASSLAREKFLWLDQVRRDPELTPLAFMLAYVLADLVNEREGCAWPGIAHLAAECRVTGKGVKKVIRSLAAHGHLCVEVGVGRGRTNRYRWIIKLETARYVGSASRARDDRGVPLLSRRDAPQVPISGQEGATTVPTFDAEKGNCGSEKGELAFQKRGPLFPQPYLMILSMILLKDPRPGNKRKSRQPASTTFGAYIRRRLIEVKLYGPSQGPSKTRRSRTSFVAPCAMQLSATGRTPASRNIR